MHNFAFSWSDVSFLQFHFWGSHSEGSGCVLFVLLSWYFCKSSSFVLIHLCSRCNLKLKDLLISWVQVQRCWVCRNLLIPSPSLTPQVIFLFLPDTVWTMPFDSGPGLYSKYIQSAYESLFSIYRRCLLDINSSKGYFVTASFMVWICTWPYLCWHSKQPHSGSLSVSMKRGSGYR